MERASLTATGEARGERGDGGAPLETVAVVVGSTGPPRPTPPGLPVAVADLYVAAACIRAQMTSLMASVATTATEARYGVTPSRALRLLEAKREKEEVEFFFLSLRLEASIAQRKKKLIPPFPTLRYLLFSTHRLYRSVRDRAVP